MRCPKCGYISFDHLESCRKCHKPLTQGEFVGTTYLAVSPLFLQIPEQVSEQVSESGFDVELEETLDPDLGLLADDGEDMFAASIGSEISPNDDFQIAFDAGNKKGQGDDADDFFFDTSRFESVPVNMEAVQVAPSAQFALPEELDDISDLAPPAPVAPAIPTPSVPMATTEMESGLDFHFDDELTLADDLALDTQLTLDDDLALDHQLSLDDDLELDDLNLSLFPSEKADTQQVRGDNSVSRGDEFATLSLDDVDLFGNLPVVPSPKPVPPPFDDDLNFDLDLGTFDFGQQSSPKKGGDDIPDFNLSLD